MMKILAERVFRRRVTVSLAAFTLIGVYSVIVGLHPRHYFPGHDPWFIVGVLLVSAGLAIRSWAAGVVRKDMRLACEGPYSLCRHPLYLGSSLMVAGFAVLINNWVSAVALAGFMAPVYWSTIRREEQGLANRFGTAWRAYVERVPALAPRHWPRGLSVAWNPKQWRLNREYEAILASALGVVALQAWSVWAGR